MHKILISGDVRGNFRVLFDRVSKLEEKKGPFEFLLSVGNFFGSSRSSWEPYVKGMIKVPILTYILGPNDEQFLEYYKDANGCELCPNVYYLGKRGILTSSGLKIAYISGVEQSDNNLIKITEKDIETVTNIARKGKDASEYLGIDILLTSEWPKNLTSLVKDVDDDVNNASKNGSQLVANLVAQLKPRYHFAGLNNIFYERPPYRNHKSLNVTSTHCTRFIALSHVNCKKWVYGVGLKPIEKISAEELNAKTSDETECPYSNKINKDAGADQYFFDMTQNFKRKSNPQKRKFSEDGCWFCLAGSQDRNTVVSIGTNAYLAVPKGGLHQRHFIICPVKHSESYLHLSVIDRMEIALFKKSVTEYYKRYEEVPVFFERYYRTSHMQLNCVPVPVSCCNNLIKTFKQMTEKYNYDYSEVESGVDLSKILCLDTPYLCFEFPDDIRFYLLCKENFQLNFAREVIANKNILNAKDKVDWKNCLLPKEEELELTKMLRKDFGKFNFFE